jgi:hypothetical protein
MSAPVATIHEYDISGSTIPLKAIVIYIAGCSLPAESEPSTTNICIHPFSIQIQPHLPSNMIESLQQRQVPILSMIATFAVCWPVGCLTILSHSSCAAGQSAATCPHSSCDAQPFLVHPNVRQSLPPSSPLRQSQPKIATATTDRLNEETSTNIEAGTAGARTPIDLLLPPSPRAAWVGGDCERPTLYGSAHAGGPLP